MIEGLKPYGEYQESGVNWLGKIPKHWSIGPGFAAFRENQTKNKGLIESQVLSLSYGKIVIKSMDKLHGLVPDNFETYQIVEPGDIIIRPTDLQNDKTSLRVGLVRDRGIITSAYICLKTVGEMTSAFGHQLLLSLDLMKVFYGLGSGLRQNLSFIDFKRLPIFIPPPDEQAAIVRFLDHANLRIDRFIRTKRKLIALLNEQKQAIIHRAVTLGIDPDVKMKDSGIPWLGEIPEHWEVLALKMILHRLIDCEHKTAPRIDSSEYRVLRTTGIRNGQLRIHGTYCTTKLAYSNWTRRGKPEVGDVVFTREAPAGEACLVPTEFNICLGQRTVLMKLRKDRINPSFLIHLIYAGPPRTAITLATQGSTVGHFNMSDIGALTVLLPTIHEQGKIVRSIVEQTKGLTEIISRAEKELELIREYRTRLTTDVVTGKVDVREAARSLPITEEESLPELDSEDLDDETELEPESTGAAA